MYLNGFPYVSNTVCMVSERLGTFPMISFPLLPPCASYVNLWRMTYKIASLCDWCLTLNIRVRMELIFTITPCILFNNNNNAWQKIKLPNSMWGSLYHDRLCTTHCSIQVMLFFSLVPFYINLSIIWSYYSLSLKTYGMTRTWKFSKLDTNFSRICET